MFSNRLVVHSNIFKNKISTFNLSTFNFLYIGTQRDLQANYLFFIKRVNNTLGFKKLCYLLQMQIIIVNSY